MAGRAQQLDGLCQLYPYLHAVLAPEQALIIPSDWLNFQSLLNLLLR